MTSNDAMLLLLAAVATTLTCVMFATRNPLLGFPAAMFWMILGADAYITSTTPWGDVYYFLFFGSTAGMGLFSMYAAYALRERHDALGDEDEIGADASSEQSTIATQPDVKRTTKSETVNTDSLFYGDESAESVSSERSRRIRDRARLRRKSGGM